MRRSLAATVACVVILAAAVTAGYCQAPPGAPGGGPVPGVQPVPGMGMPMGPGGPMGPEAMRMMMRGQQVPAIAVADGFVFVVYGGMLYQFTVDGLKEVAKAQLTGPEGDRGDRGRRGGRGARGGGAEAGGGGAAGGAGGEAGGPGLPNPEP